MTENGNGLRAFGADGSIYLKRCPRCGGDIHTARDEYGGYIHCLQCGYTADIERPNPFAALRSALSLSRDDVA